MRLHPRDGLNPKLTVCVYCGKTMDELVLMGAHTSVHECRSCGVKHIGGLPKGRKCPCGAIDDFARVGEVQPGDKLPASRLCDECQQKQDECDKAASEGGVFWRCSACGSAGALKATSEFALDVRKAHGPEYTEGPPYKHCGVEFDKDDCPVCNKELYNDNE